MNISSMIEVARSMADAGKSEHGVGIDTLRWVRAASLIIPSLFLLVILVQPWANPVWMFFDPLTAAEQSGDCCHTYYGFVSYLGIMIWTGTAAICLFCAVLLAYHGTDRSLFYFALAAGALAGWLALDDAFLLHELVLPNLGIPQVLVLAIYGVLALTYIALGWRIVLASDFWLLGIGGSALVVSLLIDTITHGNAPIRIYFEDGAKFIGLFCWGAFHVSTLLDKMLILQRSK